jgi:hypothetical protein
MGLYHCCCYYYYYHGGSLQHAHVLTSPLPDATNLAQPWFWRLCSLFFAIILFRLFFLFFFFCYCLFYGC